MMRDALAGAGANKHCIYCIPKDPKLARSEGVRFRLEGRVFRTLQ